ncbi:MAG: hypothetical protein IJA72_02950 [Clostridia bacterium]|nr:hypothetical protein [Clostridia bacterium]
MITTKADAIIEVGKDQPDYKSIDKFLLRDKDVILAYMQAHSSNRLLDLNSNFPISLDINGLINNEDFIIAVINNLDNGYNQDDLVYLLKLSTARIIQTKYTMYDNSSEDTLKGLASDILKRYHNVVVSQKLKLAHKKQVVDKVFDFIHSSRILDDLKSNDEKIIDQLTKIFDIISSNLHLSNEENDQINHCTSIITNLLRQNTEHRQNFEKYVEDNLNKPVNDRYTRNEIGFK